jgi:hypothetical protein
VLKETGMLQDGDDTPWGLRLRSILATWFDPVRWFLYTDVLIVLTAVVLPWSTTAAIMLTVLWVLSRLPHLPVLDLDDFGRFLLRPICLWPIVVFALAVVGTFWAVAPWHERIHGIGAVAKLVMLPILLYHFERSCRGAWVFVGFLASCSLLMVLSWIVLFAPELKLAATKNAGVPVKNYIDQSQAFALCMMGLIPYVVGLYRQRRYLAAAAGAAVALGFAANMAFVASARTALIYVPVMLAVFALKYLSRRGTVLLFAGLVLMAGTVWFASPYLRERIAAIPVEYHEYQLNIAASTGRRLVYWQKSLGFIARAPLFGNGTGSIRHLFEQEAVGQTGLAAEITNNAHNQTLNVAIQWGLAGLIALYAMWFVHLRLFRGEGLASWIGLLVVVQNIVSSLLNSHLFDFVEGWIYVIGVGVAGGMCLGRNGKPRTAGRDDTGISGGSQPKASSNQA